MQTENRINKLESELKNTKFTVATLCLCIAINATWSIFETIKKKNRESKGLSR